MKAEKFLELVDEVLDSLKEPYHKKNFLENMRHLDSKGLGVENMSFSRWMMTYLAWSELGSEEDIAVYYWNLEQEEK